MLSLTKKSLTLGSLALIGGLLSACSTAPLVCDHAMPTAKQIQQVRAPIQISKPKELKKLPVLTQAPSAMTLSANHAFLQAHTPAHYNLHLATHDVTDVLAIQHNSPKHYAVSIKGRALKAFWNQANPYFIHQYHYAVITARHLPSQIVRVSQVSFDGQHIDYQFVSNHALPHGYLNAVTVTVEG